MAENRKTREHTDLRRKMNSKQNKNTPYKTHHN